MNITKNQPLWRRALIVSVIAVAGVSLTGCSMINSLLPGGGGESSSETDPSSSADDDAPVEGEESSVFDIVVGDCLGSAEGDTVSDITVISCDDPHAYEVYHEFEIEGDEFPGDDAVGTAADEGCLDAFESFVGLAYDSSELEFTYFSPIEEGWNELDDKLVSCLIADPAGDTTGSLKGSAR